MGKAFLRQLLDLCVARSQHQDIRLVYLSTSSRSLSTPDYRHLTDGFDDCVHELSQSDHKPMQKESLLSFLTTGGFPSILVDNTSSALISDAYPEYLRHGISVITPNKKAFSGAQAEWDSVFGSAYPSNPSGGRLFHESTVGAGLPVICTIKDLVATGDKVTRIEGIFSGTMSFLFNSFAPAGGMTDGAETPSWSEAVRTAKQLGYTEPDPRDDLNGLDVARKCVIVARLAGLKPDSPAEGKFPIQSLIPKPLASCKDGDEFMMKLPDFDTEMHNVKVAAENAGKVVRYVGSVDATADDGRGAVKVGLQQFDPTHPIAALKGSDNIFSIYTTRYGSSPLIIQGAGAGAGVTAMGVTADLIRVLDGLPHPV